MDVLHWEATPVEIQQLISNLCANASSIDHLSGCGGDPWYDGKYLLAILWQQQVESSVGPSVCPTTANSNVSNITVMQTHLEANDCEIWTDLQMSCSTAQTCHLNGCTGCCRTFTERGRRRTIEALLGNSELKSLQNCDRSEYSRYDCVGWHYILYFFGPRVDKTKPLTLQGDKRAVFCFELVAVCLYFFFTPQHCGDRQGIDDKPVVNCGFRILQKERWREKRRGKWE